MSKKNATCDHCGERTLFGWDCPDCNRFLCNFCCGRADSKPIDRGGYTTQSSSMGPGTCPACSKKSDGGGCFIATACCGSYHAPEVVVLRSFRDDYLLKSRCGKSFVAIYYKYSPSIAERIASKKIYRAMIRSTLISPFTQIVQTMMKI